MAYSTPATWVAGDVLTAAQLNAQLRDQLLAAFPLGVDGWTTYVPTLTQSVTVTKTVTRGTYQRIGRTVIANINLSVTSAGTVSNAVLVGLPVAAAAAGGASGFGWIFDASTATRYAGSFGVAGGGVTVEFVGDWSAANVWGVVPAIALAAGDLIAGTIIYEAAA